MRENPNNQIQNFNALELVRIKEEITHKLPVNRQKKPFRLSAIEQAKDGWLATVVFRDKTKMEVKSTDDDVY
ncbi:hypothetical protein JXR01_00520 [Candidatus Kaiserbacteria bacterium]|nr:MAG: hypothetical protein JXR01_00520 [Candidatus Kaiserbacteria bacterium]